MIASSISNKRNLNCTIRRWRPANFIFLQWCGNFSVNQLPLPLFFYKQLLGMTVTLNFSEHVSLPDIDVSVLIKNTKINMECIYGPAKVNVNCTALYSRISKIGIASACFMNSAVPCDYYRRWRNHLNIIRFTLYYSIMPNQCARQTVQNHIKHKS